jgi:membrane-associated phospholipid phosphatase
VTAQVTKPTAAARRSCHDRPASRGRRTVAEVLADPRVRLGAGAAGLLVTALPVHADRVGARESRVFRAVNGLPDACYVPAWMIMQLGTLGAAPAAAGAAWLAGDSRLAARLAAGGSITWALAKLVKGRVRRPRPAGLLTGTRSRGREPSGLGFLSGHAGVVTALAAAAFHRFGPAGRAAVAAAVPLVSLSRVYVGAHLPLDIVGGAALGLAVDAATDLAQSKLMAVTGQACLPRAGQPVFSHQVGLPERACPFSAP